MKPLKPPKPFKIPVPGLTQPVGLGDLVSRATTALGVKPCSPCARRAALLNHLAVLSPTGNTASADHHGDH